MKIFDKDILFAGKVVESIEVTSYDDYHNGGGQLDMFDVYALIKTRAKKYESLYIQGMDMSLSGISVDEDVLKKDRLLAQVLWTILHLWFNKPLRVVSFSNFDLDEFNKL